MARKKYLNNRDLLKQIHLSKNTYSSYTDKDYAQYDIILDNIGRINIRTIAQAKRNKADRLQKLAHQELADQGIKTKLAEHAINWKKYDKTDVVFRIHTFDHIPLEPCRKKNPKTVADHHTRLYFPPFQHFIFNSEDDLICVGKSHWEGGMENGHYSDTGGRMTDELGKMFMKLCERYGGRYNWRGYCVDETTEALTKRGWLNINEITEQDTILSYDDGELKWSSIKSIYRGDYNGLMHKITTKTGIDMLVTPNHKLVTERGLIPVDYLLESDRVVLNAAPLEQPTEVHPNNIVELVGWIVTEGHYEYRDGILHCISIWQNEGKYADRIRNCLNESGYTYSESMSKRGNICFRIRKVDSHKIIKYLPEKNLSMEFILSLTTSQRELLINTMIDGDGWRVGKSLRYCQKDKSHIDLFQALCFLSGKRSNAKLNNITSYGKSTQCYTMNIFSDRKNHTRGECLDFHGGKKNGREFIGKGKINHPNEPTEYYKGKVWCPETEYGSFVARRGHSVYLTGNTYNDEMQQQALMQLSQVGLQFDESKSQNPFAYYTAIINASFTRVLNIEKRGHNIRDDILEMNGLTPSFTRQAAAFDQEFKEQTESVGIMNTGPRKAKQNHDDAFQHSHDGMKPSKRKKK